MPSTQSLIALSPDAPLNDLPSAPSGGTVVVGGDLRHDLLRFLAMVSRDLRHPLHAIGLFIDGLLPTAHPAHRRTILRLQEATGFMGVLLDGLLEVSLLDAQTLTPSLARVPLAPLFDQLGAQHADARARVVWKDRGLTVTTDAALLRRIINHLVDNAVRYTPPGGTVLVAARRRDGAVRIEVRDNGVGIAPVHQAPIFEEFYQVGASERDHRQGLGLGLAVSSRIALLLGSRIQLRSAPRAGSTFWLDLPGAPASEP
jgi:signal transduction histidine kinase